MHGHERPRVHPHVPARLRESADRLLGALESLLEARWSQLSREHFPAENVPHHTISFSKLITSSWALIYYRRHLIRLSPYLFLLEPHELRRGTYWEELDATLKHELVHAHLYARDREVGHPPEFARLLSRLGVDANGCADLGPQNVAFRYEYGCATCGHEWKRRAKLRGKWSCGRCSPGKFDANAVMELNRVLPRPWDRLVARHERIADTVSVGRTLLTQAEPAEVRVPVMRRREKEKA